MAKRKRENRRGYGKLLDAWTPPPSAGTPLACLATTFTFSPAFFEEECLGRFVSLETDAYEDGSLYLIEREEKFAQLSCASVLVDQHHCHGVRSLRWDLIPARIPKGILHAKISLLCWSDLVRLIISSANLTEDGYRRNLEIYGVLDYQTGGEAPLPVLIEVLDFLRDAARRSGDGDSQAVSRWNSSLDQVATRTGEWGAGDAHRSRNGLKVHASLVGPGRTPALDRFDELWPSGARPDQALIVSPFFDQPGKPNRPAKAIWNLLKKRGSARVDYLVNAEPVAGDEKDLLIKAPESLLESQPSSSRALSTNLLHMKEPDNRPLHAKILWLECERWVGSMVGSSNFTSAGLGIGNTKNLEANLIYLVDRERHEKDAKSLARSLPDGSPFGRDTQFRWLQEKQPSEDDPGEDLLLHPALISATFEVQPAPQGAIRFHFGASVPEGLTLTKEDGKFLFWGVRHNDIPNKAFEIKRPWDEDRPPSGFYVSWSGVGGRAWWPVNVDAATSLPPPEELRDLPLEVLVDILTSTQPLHKALKGHLKRKKSCKVGDLGLELDPHRKVDTSRFLLRRTRRASWALGALRQRLERPAYSSETLLWRLEGPVGVLAVADAIQREADSEAEKAFLLCELALELHSAQPKSAPGSLPVRVVSTELGRIVGQLRAKIDQLAEKGTGNINHYVHKVFEVMG